MKNKVLIITGMHRSGTSLLAEYLDHCGLFLGEQIIDGGLVKDGSRGGHHEDKDFVDFHNSALKKRNIPVFLKGALKKPISLTTQEQTEARKMIEAREKVPQWGWKDPRTSLFLDAWDELIEDCNFMFVFRHPLSVIDSLLRRGKDSTVVHNPLIGLKTWQIYNREIIKFLNKKQENCLLFDIDQFTFKYERLRLELKERFDLKLNEVQLNEFFEKRAFKDQVSEATEKLSEQNKTYFSECLKTFEELKEISLQQVK